MDLAMWMEPGELNRLLAVTRRSEAPRQRIEVEREPLRLTSGWTNRLFVGVKGAWRGWFALSGDVVRPVERVGAWRRYGLVVNARLWTPIAPVRARRFKRWRYASVENEAEISVEPASHAGDRREADGHR